MCVQIHFLVGFSHHLTSSGFGVDMFSPGSLEDTLNTQPHTSAGPKSWVVRTLEGGLWKSACVVAVCWGQCTAALPPHQRAVSWWCRTVHATKRFRVLRSQQAAHSKENLGSWTWGQEKSVSCGALPRPCWWRVREALSITFQSYERIRGGRASHRRSLSYGYPDAFLKPSYTRT